MNPKDFRIGNYVEYDYPEDGWWWHPLASDDMEDIHDDDIFRPLPITEEQLILLGFKRNPDFNWHRDYMWNEFIHPSGWSTSILNDEEGYVFENGSFETQKALKYVHQLQNLVYVMTGEEIEYVKPLGSTGE